eukprot:2189523-Heterocapsa_arctica.AAC.1
MRVERRRDRPVRTPHLLHAALDRLTKTGHLLAQVVDHVVALVVGDAAVVDLLDSRGAKQLESLLCRRHSAAHGRHLELELAGVLRGARRRVGPPCTKRARGCSDGSGSNSNTHARRR